MENGKVKSASGHPLMLECLDFCAKLAKAGLVHPDALAGINTANPSRFKAGKVLIEGGGTGGWNSGDAKTGIAAKPGYVRAAFPLFSYDGSTPTIGLGPGSGWISYLNKSLSPDQIKECLRIADYFAAPFGSYEYNLVNFGVEGVHYTMGADGPVRTTDGSNTAANQIYNFLGAPQQQVYNAGYPEVTKASRDLGRGHGQVRVQAAVLGLEHHGAGPVLQDRRGRLLRARRRGEGRRLRQAADVLLPERARDVAAERRRRAGDLVPAEPY